MDRLVERLSAEGQDIAVGGPAPSVEEFHHRLTELKYVFLKFTGTRGGTDLGVRVDDATDLGTADFTTATGSVHVEGTLTLNFQPVRCIADIDLTTLTGTGHLTPVG
ncbi:hypothetical protein PWY87_08815 [Kribbella solani]|uniref:hypothetical protein n=1 Tax=Kribbella solani TaxID=236067 RepID=UPI0029B962D2|nr:hypothetical protein [Kribbella solani]MDX3001765.1 hypothetical protein [Kribbella solani]